MTSESITLLSEDRYSIKPFKHITIGDPSYWGDRQAEKLTLDNDFPVRGRKAEIIIKSSDRNFTQQDGSSFVFNELSVTIASYKKDGWFAQQDGVKVHADDKIFGGVYEKTVLGCDTARFDMSVDGKGDEFHTGADGVYGECYRYGNEAVVIQLFLDADACSERRLRDSLSYIFDCPAISKPVAKDKGVEKE